MTKLPLILASSSPRRQAYLKMLGLNFNIHTADIDETPRKNESPPDLVRRLSQQKAKVVAQNYPQAIIIAADTVVVLNEQILGKPTSPNEAHLMLRRLRNQKHQVYSAISIMNIATDEIYVSLCNTDVWMRPYTDTEIEIYVASGDPMDKAGAYAIQNPDFAPVTELKGCYASVVGLPLEHLAEGLAKFGIDIENVGQKCSAYTGQNCCMLKKL